MLEAEREVDMRLMDEIGGNRTSARWASLLPRVVRQVGGVQESDSEVLPLGGGRALAAAVATVAEEVRTGLYREPATAGRIAAVAALSNLAAVGADPLGVLLAVGLPSADAERIQTAVASGVAEICREAGIGVLGGDSSDAPALTVTCFGVGEVPLGAVIRRVGLAPGDVILASGPLGLGAALAAARWLDLPAGLFDERDFRPPLRTTLGRALRGVASACIDTGQGLIAALDRLARLNGVAVRVERPLAELLHPSAEAVRRRLGLPVFPLLAGPYGEFELLFSVPPARLDRLACATALAGWAPLEVGRAEAGSGLVLDGEDVDGDPVRNLASMRGADSAAYVHALCEMAVGG